MEPNLKRQPTLIESKAVLKNITYFSFKVWTAPVSSGTIQAPPQTTAATATTTAAATAIPAAAAASTTTALPSKPTTTAATATPTPSEALRQELPRADG